MNKKIKVISKGYTIEVVSWENDGDNYNTKSIVVDSREKAEAYYNLLQLCKSGVLGNADEFHEKEIRLIAKSLKGNPILVEKGFDFSDNDEVEGAFHELIHDLLGGSEYYACRVMEECTITYSPEDIFLEEIKFNEKQNQRISTTSLLG